MNNNTILYLIEKYNLYGKDLYSVKKSLSKSTNKSLQEIDKKFDELIKSKKIQIINGAVEREYVINAKHTEVYSEPVQEQKPLKMSQNDTRRILGTICLEKNQYIFKPSKFVEKDKIILPETDEVKQSVGKRACCQVKLVDNKLTARIERVFGVIDDPINEISAIAYSYGFSTEFPSAVIEQIENIPQEVTEKDLINRTDMRDIYFMPWDPATAKDKDDAIYAEKTEEGYKVYVAIADVSHYVKMDNSPLGREAFKRSTSGYFGSGVYPMLPTELSNGICSLNNGADRLALVAVMNIDKKGNLLNYDFKKAVINIKRAFCYEDAEKVYLCQDGYDKKYAYEKPLVDLLYEVADVLEKKLINRGKLDFTGKEPDYKFNKERNMVEDVAVGNQERSHIVVEQFMILANEATAQFFKDNKLDGIYRIHSAPLESKVEEMNSMLVNYGIPSINSITNKEYQKLISKIHNMKTGEYLEDCILQSLTKAEYSPINEGHFGLASSGYTHFTSPIRRYSDLVAHTIISSYISTKQCSLKSKNIAMICKHINDRERAAVKAERQSDYYLACLWAENHMNQTFKARIYKFDGKSMVVKYNTVEMTLPYEALGGRLVSKKNGLMLVDKTTMKKYYLGEEIPVTIVDVDKESREIIVTPTLENINEKSA